MGNELTCSVCHGVCSVLDEVDFNKSCEEAKGKFLGLAGVPVSYVLCSDCGFCFAPEISTWTLHEFEDRIYNDQYVMIDPDYIEARPRSNAALLASAFDKHSRSIRHLDYGGGSGLLARILNQSGWNSVSYDPFVDKQMGVEQLGKFDLITAFEVFEHVPDVQRLMSDLRSLISPDAIILFSTILSDGHIGMNRKLEWWYASPRNGHISLFSKKSLDILAEDSGFRFHSFNEGFHAFSRRCRHGQATLLAPAD